MRRVSGLRGGRGGSRLPFLGDVGDVWEPSFLFVNCIEAGRAGRGGLDEDAGG